MTSVGGFNRRTTYGQRGGEGPTAGKKASRYRVVLPNGVTAIKRSFFVHCENAVISCYLHDGKWYANAVFPVDKIEAWAQPNAEGTRVVLKAELLP